MGNAIREKACLPSLGVLRIATGASSRRISAVRKQLLRAGTGVGANIEESQSAESREDFAHKIGVALKEARETHSWLRLCRDGGLLSPEGVRDLLALADEVIRIGSSIVKSSKSRPAA